MTKYNIASINDYYDDTGSVRRRRHRRSTTPASEQFGPVDLQQAITVSSDAYFYTVGNDFWKVWKAGDKPRGPRYPERGARARLRRARPASSSTRRAGRVPEPVVEVGVRRRELQVEDASKTERHVVSRRRHLPRGRPGRSRGHAAATRERVRRVRQRRHAVAAAHRGQGRDARGQDGRARCSRRRSGTSRSTPPCARRCSPASRVRSPSAEPQPGDRVHQSFQGFPLAQYSGRRQDRHRAGDGQG